MSRKRARPPSEPQDAEEDEFYVPLKRRRKADPDSELRRLLRLRKKKRSKKRGLPVSSMGATGADSDSDTESSSARPHDPTADPNSDPNGPVFGPTGTTSLLARVLRAKKLAPVKTEAEIQAAEEAKLLQQVSVRKALIPISLRRTESTAAVSTDSTSASASAAAAGSGSGSGSSSRVVSRLNWGWKPPSVLLGMAHAEQLRILRRYRIRVEQNETSPRILGPILRWEQMRLPPPLVGFLTQGKKMAKPTPIQAIAVPAILDGRDLIGISYTGSGKTLAFVLPGLLFAVLQERRLPLVSGEGPIVLILCPNRELAKQTHFVALEFARGGFARTDAELRVLLCMGGMRLFAGKDEGDGRRTLMRGPHIVVATPGRLLHMLQEERLSLKDCKYVVLDEADRLVDLGFEATMRDIFDFFPASRRQTVLFSATMPPKIQAFAKTALTDPLIVNVGRPGASSMNVIQEIEAAEPEEKLSRLLRVLQKTGPPVLIFASDKNDVDDVHEFLLRKKVNAAALHGAKEQIERNFAVDAFRDGLKDVLIATDMASKGLDFENVKHVINFDMPREVEDYVHRIGRTGRWGGEGVGLATTFVNSTECDKSLMVDLKHLLVEAHQEVPTFLQRLDDGVHVFDTLGELPESVLTGGCTYCGGLGHRITCCKKLLRDAKKNVQKMRMRSDYD